MDDEPNIFPDSDAPSPLGRKPVSAFPSIEDFEGVYRQIAQAYRELVSAIDAMQDLIVIYDHEFRVVRANLAYAERAGLSVGQVIGKPYWKLFPNLANPPPGSVQVLELRHATEEELHLDSGEIFLARYFPILDSEGEHLYSLLTMQDITEERNDEATLRESVEQFRAMTSAAQDAMLMLDDTGHIVFWNNAASRIFGYSIGEALGHDVNQLLAPERDLNAYRAIWTEVGPSGPGEKSGKVLEVETRRKDGSSLPVELSVSAFQLKGRWHAVGILRDISERKRAEIALKRSLRTHRALSACNANLVRATEEQQLLNDMCQTMIKEGEYLLTWIGFVEHNADKSVRPVASAGYEVDYLESLHITWADNENGQGPTARAVRLGTPQVTENSLLEPQYASSHGDSQLSGYGSSIALPLIDDNNAVFGVLNIYDSDLHAFDDAEYRLLQELAGDLSFGLLTLRTRAERDHYAQEILNSVEQRKKALTATIQAIARTVERRDPYTAGHQSRVAALATAIGEEIGLDQDRLEGLQLGALIHDIGKIYVPLEILSQPGLLSKFEIGIIRSHPAVGYEIVKDISFPWPVAQMLLQHHERMDGSGYPSGLSGDEIILEARILAVADVVEAITAHRPYRPAQSMATALAEIEAKSGQLYDAAIADACLRLFREKGYTFEEIAEPDVSGKG